MAVTPSRTTSSVWTPGQNVGRSIEFSSTCWLIQRGKEWLLWDTGVPESALNDPKGWSTLPKLIVYHLDKTLTDQLAAIGLKTTDITYVALSHTHGDHIGNVRLFPDSTVLMQRAEYAWISSPDGPNDNVNQLKALARKLLGTPKHLKLLDGERPADTEEIMVAANSLTAAAASIVGHRVQTTSLESTSATTTYHRMTVDGVGVFYREAGPKKAPAIVLLHGFPSSSREFDTLIPLLATRYHLIAPDFPGFGQSDAPPPSSYAYTFDNLARTINRLLEQLTINKYTLYLHDYGGPVGFRIILAHPERLQALIIQNANAYKEGLGAKWAGIAQYWADPKAHPEVFDAFVSLTATEQRHTLGTSHPERYNPDTWTDEYAHLSRPGQREIQADLLYDYRANVASYSGWQAWLREHKPPTLVVWGRNDPSFIAPGAEAFERDLPDAEIHLLDAGHFALDEKNDEIASLILAFLAKHLI